MKNVFLQRSGLDCISINVRRDAIHFQLKHSSINMPLKYKQNQYIFQNITREHNWLSVFITKITIRETEVKVDQRTVRLLKSDNGLELLAMIFARLANFEVAVKTFPCTEAIHRGKYRPSTNLCRKSYTTTHRVEKCLGKTKNTLLCQKHGFEFYYSVLFWL